MAEDTRTWILICIEPVQIDMNGIIHTYAKSYWKDANNYNYDCWKRLIAKYDFQVGDDMKVCLWNAINKIEPVRPPQKEYIKKELPNMFSTNLEDYDKL